MAEELKCPICGEPTVVWYGNARKDGLCRKHSQELKDGIIEQCTDCGKWHKTGKVCECKTKINDTVSKETNDNDITCIICGKPSNGKHFCLDCYRKYKNKEILLKIKKCSDFEILDDTYEGIYQCDDGHIVKSKSEYIIDNYLFEKNIAHAYENPLSIDGDSKHDLHPDFYLPNFCGKDEDAYLEHWGYDETNEDYTNKKEYKIQKYKELKITLICTNEKIDGKNFKAALKRKLSFYKKNEINYEND